MEGEEKLMFRCELAARTCAGIQNDLPTLTNLDRASQYQLTLKRVNEKIKEDHLNVSIFLGLGSNLENDISNQDLLRKWKALHDSERLLNVELNENQANGGNQIIDAKQIDKNVDSVYLSWSQDEEINLNVRFNCVSSQFPFKRNKTFPDETFILNIVFTSHILGNWKEEQCCQVSNCLSYSYCI